MKAVPVTALQFTAPSSSASRSAPSGLCVVSSSSFGDKLIFNLLFSNAMCAGGAGSYGPAPLVREKGFSCLSAASLGIFPGF